MSRTLPDQLRIRQFAGAEATKLAAEAGSLDAAERRAWVGADEIVDEDGTGFNSGSDALGALGIAAPDGGAEALFGVVG